MNKPVVEIKIVDLKEFQELIRNAEAANAEVEARTPYELLVEQMQFLAEESMGADRETLVKLSNAMCEIYKAMMAY